MEICGNTCTNHVKNLEPQGQRNPGRYAIEYAWCDDYLTWFRQHTSQLLCCFRRPLNESHDQQQTAGTKACPNSHQLGETDSSQCLSSPALQSILAQVSLELYISNCVIHIKMQAITGGTWVY